MNRTYPVSPRKALNTWLRTLVLTCCCILPTSLWGQDTVRVCAGALHVFTANTSNAQAYEWDFDGDGIIDAISNPAQHQYATVDTFLASLTLTSGACSDSDSVIVISHQVNIDSVKTDGSICATPGSGVTSVNVSGGSGNISYLWSDGQMTQMATGLVPGIYTVVVQDTLGCSDSATAAITGPPTLTVNAGPTSYVILNSGPGSAPQPVVSLQALPIGGIPPYAYAWTPVNYLDEPGSATPLANPPDTMLYSVTVTDLNGCQAIDSVWVIVIDIATLPSTGNNLYLCHQGRTIRVIANAPCQDPNSLCYHLNHGDLLEPCPPSLISQSEIPLKEAEMGSQPMDRTEETLASLRIFPNPFTTSPTVQFQVPTPDQCLIQVFSMDGKVLATSPEYEVKGGEIKEWELPGEKLFQGAYILQMTTTTGRILISRIVKH